MIIKSYFKIIRNELRKLMDLNNFIVTFSPLTLEVSGSISKFAVAS